MICGKNFNTDKDEFVCKECMDKKLKECKICGLSRPDNELNERGVCKQCNENLKMGYKFEPTTKVWMDRKKAELLGFNFDKDLIE